MNHEIKLLTEEWIETEARKRRQIPIAVFTIVAVHVVLFLSLLGSSGCSRNKAHLTSDDRAPTRPSFAHATADSNTGSALVEEPVMAEPAVLSPTEASQNRSAAAAQSLVSASGDLAAKIYVVKPGDSLSKIARANGTTPKAIKQVNGLKNDVIRVGQKLRLS